MIFREGIHPRELLSPYLDGELPKDARAAVEAHLAACAPCRSLLQDFRALAAANLREAPPPVPAELAGRIRRAIESQEGSGGAPRRWSLWSYRLGLAAAASVVLIVGLWILRPAPVPPVGVPAPPTMASNSAGEMPPPPAETGVAPAPRPNETPESLGPLGDLGGGTESKKEPPPPPSASQRRSTDRGRRLQQEAVPRTAPPAVAWESPPSRPPVAPEDRPGPAGEPSPAAPAGPGRRAGAAQEGIAAGSPEFPRSEAGKIAAGAVSSTTPASGRTLVVEYPDHRVSVSGDGTLVLSAERYECAARLEGPSVDPEITALFALASSGGADAREAQGAAPRGAPEVRLLEPRTDSGTTGAAAPRVAAWKRIEIGNRLRSLLRERYWVLLESRCGPVPRNIRTP